MKLGQTVLLQWDAKGNHLGTAVRNERFSVRKRKAEHVASGANRDVLDPVNRISHRGRTE